MSVSGRSSVLGRGRGRARPIKVPPTQENLLPTTEDVVDANVGNRTSLDMKALRERYDEKRDSSDELGSGNRRQDSKPLQEKKQNVPAVVVDQMGVTPTIGKEPTPRGFKILSVDLEKKCTMVAFMREKKTIVCKPVLYESLDLKKWEKENGPLLKAGAKLSDMLLELLQSIHGQYLNAILLQPENSDEMPSLAVDLFSLPQLKRQLLLMTAVKLCPTFHEEPSNKLAIITNFPGDGTLQVVLYDHTYLGLQEIIQAVQLKHKIYGPGDLSAEEAEELLKSFEYGMRYFLAPFRNDWTNLQRVKVIGHHWKNAVVRVLYLDLGKQETIPVTNLVFSLFRKLPELADKIRPLTLSVPLYVDTVEQNSRINASGVSYEGKVCFLQKRAGDVVPGSIKVFVPNPDGDGCFDLLDVLTCEPDQKPALHQRGIWTSMNKSTKAVERRLQSNQESWKARFEEQRQEHEKLEAVITEMSRLK